MRGIRGAHVKSTGAQSQLVALVVASFAMSWTTYALLAPAPGPIGSRFVRPSGPLKIARTEGDGSVFIRSRATVIGEIKRYYRGEK